MHKKMAFIGLAAMLMMATFIVLDLEENDAVTEYPVTIFYHPNATIVFDGTTVTYPNSSEPYGYGDPITITATLATGYTFDHWHGINITEGEPWDAYSNSTGISISGNVVTYNIWCYGETEFTLYLSGGPVTNYTITFYSDSNNWGTIDFDAAPMAVGNEISVPYGTQFYISDDAITIFTSPYANFVYAEPNPDWDGWHYTFDSWSWNEGSHTVTSNISITAYFDRNVARYNVTFAAGTGGSVSPASVSNVPYNSYASVNGNQITLNNTLVVATPDPGYEFSSWSNATGPITGNRTITANFTQIQTYTVTVNHNSAYGYVSKSTFTSVPVGTSISASDNVLTVGNQTSTATAKSPSAIQTFRFDGWTGIPQNNTVTSNLTITAVFSAAYKDFPVTVNYHPNATITFDGTTVTYPNSAESYGYGDPITITATLATGYTFDHWYGYNSTEGEGWTAGPSSSGITISGNVVTYQTWCYGVEEFTLYLTGGPGTNYTVTFSASPVDYGSMSSTTVQAQYGVSWYISGDKFYIDGQIASRAIPNASDLSYTYSFDGWSYVEPSGTVTDNMTVTAYFSRSPVVHSSGVHWTNGMYNGMVEMVYKFGESNNKTHTMTMDLYEGIIDQNEQTRWNQTGYSLEIVQSFTSSATITATLMYHGSPTDATATITPGKWMVYKISIDTDKGMVYVTPVKAFYSFTDYTLYDKQKRVVLDYSNRLTGTAVSDIVHTESAEGVNSPYFSVVGTSVFLNTFGVVLYNPTINLHDYFPQYEAIRVNFYSFALYGESITINGVTYALDGSKITVQYVSDGNEHYLPGVLPNAEVQTRTFELSNIYVTYEDGHCYLTFVNDRFTLDLGSYTVGNEVISMNGLWYFATMVYEPYTAVEKHISDWKILPETDGPQMVLMFCGILIIAGAAIAIHVRKSGLGIIDLVIIGGALVVGLLTLG